MSKSRFRSRSRFISRVMNSGCRCSTWQLILIVRFLFTFSSVTCDNESQPTESQTKESQTTERQITGAASRQENHTVSPASAMLEDGPNPEKDSSEKSLEDG
ncbi:hypothetical protein EGW08_002927, partial [Elysia chlorotica]